MRRVLSIAVVAGLVAGCGADAATPYTAKATAPCLRDAGFAVSTADRDVGVIAASAARGGLHARVKGNDLIVAFGRDAREALDLARGYRRFAPKKVRKHLRDILSRQRNAILVWTVAPTQLQLQTVQKCLAS